MPGLNWGRLILGGLVATIILFITDGLFHERIVSADWKAVYDNLRAAPPPEHGVAVLYFVVFELGRGLVGMFLYVMMRQHLNPGPKTAVLAALVTWLAFSVTGPAQFIPLGFYSHSLWLKAAGFQLITSILAMLAGAALYKDAGART